jgi:hypothetical protein
MKRCDHKTGKRKWVAVASRWIEMLWRCRCEYTNIASYRCYGCGSRPPRQLRQAVVASVEADPAP